MSVSSQTGLGIFLSPCFERRREPQGWSILLGETGVRREMNMLNPVVKQRRISLYGEVGRSLPQIKGLKGV